MEVLSQPQRGVAVWFVWGTRHPLVVHPSSVVEWRRRVPLPLWPLDCAIVGRGWVAKACYAPRPLIKAALGTTGENGATCPNLITGVLVTGTSLAIHQWAPPCSSPGG